MKPTQQDDLIRKPLSSKQEKRQQSLVQFLSHSTTVHENAFYCGRYKAVISTCLSGPSSGYGAHHFDKSADDLNMELSAKWHRKSSPLYCCRTFQSAVFLSRSRMEVESPREQRSWPWSLSLSGVDGRVGLWRACSGVSISPARHLGYAESHNWERAWLLKRNQNGQAINNFQMVEQVWPGSLVVSKKKKKEKKSLYKSEYAIIAFPIFKFYHPKKFCWISWLY